MSETEQPWTAKGLSPEDRAAAVFEQNCNFNSCGQAKKVIADTIRAAVRDALAEQQATFFKQLASTENERSRIFFYGGQAYKCSVWGEGYLEEEDTSVGWEDEKP